MARKNKLPVDIKPVCNFQYGRMGLVNYIKREGRPLSDVDLLTFKTLPPKGLKKSLVIDTQSYNCLMLTNSLWRMMANTINAPALTDVSEFEGIKRRVQGVYLDQLCPGLHDHPKVWETHGLDLLDANARPFDNLGSLIRHSGIAFTTVLRRNERLTSTVAQLITKLWQLMGYPLREYFMAFRFFVYSSSIPGATWEDKAKALKKFKKLDRKLCIIADDLKLVECIKLAKATNQRATFDFTKVKTKQGKVITPDTSEFQAMIKHTWKDHPGSSGFAPTIFVKDNLPRETETKILKAYRRASCNVLFC